MTMPTFAHSELLSSLGDFFDATLTIQQNAPSRDALGHPVPGWSDLPGHVDLPCRAAPAAVPLARREARGARETYASQRLAVVLRGRYAAITTLHRALLYGQTYNIVTVEGDSDGLYTRLLLERIA
jgi:hypothetical protein